MAAKKRGPGRPALPKAERREERVLRVPATKAESDRWKRAAKVAGLSLAEWIRRACDAAVGGGT